MTSAAQLEPEAHVRALWAAFARGGAVEERRLRRAIGYPTREAALEAIEAT